MGRPKGEGSEMLRVPTGLVAQVRALILEYRGGTAVPRQPSVPRPVAIPEAPAEDFSTNAQMRRFLDRGGKKG